MAEADFIGEKSEEVTNYPLSVDYCGVCSMPPEYCEFSPNPAKCHEWMKIHLPAYYSRLVEKVSSGLSGITISGDKKQSRGGKAIKKAKKEVVPCIKISKQLRSKKKHVVIVVGLKTCDIDLKKASKQFATHFSCGSSVTGEDEIVIQGDVIEDIVDFIISHWPHIDEDCIQIIKDKKKS